MERHYDIVVIGSGGGTKIAFHAAKSGMNVALIEQGPFGGTCVNRGCVPSKMLIYPADVVHTILSSVKLNVRVGNPEIEYSELIRRVIHKVDSLADKIQTKYENNDNVAVFPTRCRFIEDKKIRIEGEVITGDRFYLAIGAHPHIPDIEGLSGTPYLTSTEALRLENKPRKLTIIGGGFISAEMGHFFATMGVEVEILSRSAFLNKIDSTVREQFIKEFRKINRVHEFATDYSVKYEKDTFTVNYKNQDNENRYVNSDALLVATGMRSWSDGIGIENTSIKVSKRGFILVDEYLKTAAPDTWAYGDCIGHALFRHMANYEGDYLKNQLLSNAPLLPIDYPPIPFAIFTHPQIGVVGKTEEQLKGEGVAVITGTAEYKNSDMGLARRSEAGLVKLIFDTDSRRLLSTHIVGEEAATMIHIPIAFIQGKATLDDIVNTVFIHPALPEVISSAAYDAKKKIK